ncbi:hypothetical protein F383_13233 [Gossypium arboreum]|uniref:Uncharacterized protein n=1 Tax=Gossypium arboreum TaxID=29729 RepID=A0A0B0PSG8_GOSAR|nr:hypothetical protein F383_13233 [Gossypium arboreum]
MQPSNHHRTVADGAPMTTDFTNGGEPRLCQQRYGGRGSDVVHVWVVNGGGGSGRWSGARHGQCLKHLEG